MPVAFIPKKFAHITTNRWTPFHTHNLTMDPAPADEYSPSSLRATVTSPLIHNSKKKLFSALEHNLYIQKKIF
jgi:hypothetical protein